MAVVTLARENTRKAEINSQAVGGYSFRVGSRPPGNHLSTGLRGCSPAAFHLAYSRMPDLPYKLVAGTTSLHNNVASSISSEILG